MPSTRTAPEAITRSPGFTLSPKPPLPPRRMKVEASVNSRKSYMMSSISGAPEPPLTAVM